MYEVNPFKTLLSCAITKDLLCLFLCLMALFIIYLLIVPFGHSLLQLFEQVLVEFVELWEVVQDLIENALFNHRFPTLMRCVGHRIAEVL